MLIDTKDIRFYNQPMLKKSLSFIILFFFIVSSLGVKNVLAQSVADNSQVQEELDSQATETTNIQAPEAANAQETVAQENLQKLPEEQKAVEQAAPEPTPMAAAAKIVKSIDIQGNKSIGVAQVLAKIKTRVGQEYQENVVSDDLKRLYNTGHFSDVQIDHEDVDDGYKVIVKLKEKPIVDQITFSKIRYYNKRFLESKMNTKKDKFLDNKTLKEDINTIEELYKKKGLTQVKVDLESFVDETTNKVTLHFIIREGYRTKIKHINVFGNTAYTDKKIITTIKSRWAWLFNQGYLKDDVLQEDMTRIQTFYEQNGFIDAKATYKVEPLYKGMVNVNITIEEGKRYYVGEVTIQGNVIFTEYDIVSSMKNIKTGNIFSHEKLEDDLNNVRNAYFDRGYISATAEEATSFNTDTGKVDIKISIKEGNLAYINQIKIQGNTNTRDIVVRRELRMYPGDQFDGKQLRKSKERLRNLGYFEDVGYDIEDTDISDKKDLVVQVKEAKTGTFSFGGGYSTVDKLVGFAEIEQKNFDFANFPSFTGGGQNLKLRGQLGSTQQQALLSFTEPWVFDYPVSAGFDGFLTKINKDSSNGYAYDESRLGGDVRLGKSFNDNLFLNTYYKLEQIKIGNLDSNVSTDLSNEEGKNVVSSTGVSLTHDYRDNPVAPTQGLLWVNSADLAGGFLGGDKDFYRFQTNASYYIPFKFSETTTVLKFGGRTGVIKAYGDSNSVPIFERYFAGGEQTIRGYDERKVGPIDPRTNDAIGGEATILGTVEYTVPLLDIIKAALFFDTGNVWSKSKDYGNGGFKSGYGPGLRVKTPIGPINLDYGFPINKQSDGESKSGKFYFSVSRGF